MLVVHQTSDIPSLFVESPASAYNTGCGETGSYKQIRKEVETKAEKENGGNAALLCSIHAGSICLVYVSACLFLLFTDASLVNF